MTKEALQEIFSHEALKAIIHGNIHQDVCGMLGHPEFHYDGNKIKAGNRYIASQRKLVIQSILKKKNPVESWKAFGRLLHAVQDFYSHTNYILLWTQKHQHKKDVRKNNFYDTELLASPKLLSGHFFLLQEILCEFPFIGKLYKNILPHNSHARMNLDSPSQGPLFELAYWAAVQRTRKEYEHIITLLKKSTNSLRNIALFRGVTN